MGIVDHGSSLGESFPETKVESKRIASDLVLHTDREVKVLSFKPAWSTT